MVSGECRSVTRDFAFLQVLEQGFPISSYQRQSVRIA